jgi:hypothetical protein
VLETAWITWERERRPRRSGLARLSRRRDNGPDRPGGLLRPPLRHYDRSAQGAEKVWTGDLQTPCGSAGEARPFKLQRLVRRSLTPRPVPDMRPGGGIAMPFSRPREKVARQRRMSARAPSRGWADRNRQERKFVTTPLTTGSGWHRVDSHDYPPARSRVRGDERNASLQRSSRPPLGMIVARLPHALAAAVRSKTVPGDHHVTDAPDHNL